MNAYELADALFSVENYYTEPQDEALISNASAMLRQQADRIATLEGSMPSNFVSKLMADNVDLEALVQIQADRIAELEKEKKHLTAYVDYFGDEIVTPQTKPLTEEEINQIIKQQDWFSMSWVDMVRRIEAKIRGEW